MEYEPGNTVRLKSGGPPMTVETVYGPKSSSPGFLFCVWFMREAVGEKVSWTGPHRQDFAADIVEPYTIPKAGDLGPPGRQR